MRHRKSTAKLGRTGEHRNAMLANLVCSLIKHRRVTTTLAKAKAARPFAEKMVTLAKSGTLHHRRLASARLHQDENAVRILFKEIVPTQQDRNGGYTRIVKLHRRRGDAAETAILEWVEAASLAEGEAGAASGGRKKPASSAAKAKKQKEVEAEAGSPAPASDADAEAKKD